MKGAGSAASAAEAMNMLCSYLHLALDTLHVYGRIQQLSSPLYVLTLLSNSGLKGQSAVNQACSVRAVNRLRHCRIRTPFWSIQLFEIIYCPFSALCVTVQRGDLAQ